MRSNFTNAVFGLALAVGIPLGFIALATWWLEDRFGSDVALMTWGGAIGLIAFSLGAFLAHRISKSTLTSVADFMDSNAQTEKGRATLYREYARGEREAFAQRAKIEVLDARRVDRLAAERAKLLTQSDKNAPTWYAGEDVPAEADDGFTFYE